MSDDVLFNPFPGLRPFEPDEEHLFFGREGQSEQILRRLQENRLVALVGASGSGKSSLIRAGLLPFLYGGFLAGAGSHWRIAICSPGGAPIRNVASALCAPSALGTVGSQDDLANDVDLMEVTLRRSSFGLVDAVQLARLPKHEQLVIIIDQFEELFRFASLVDQSARSDDANTLVRLLVEASRQRDYPIYIVLGMRSDFIGDCARFRDLPETVMSGLYLIPRMTREQRRSAIQDPIRVGGGKIAPRLVNRLLNDTGDNPDQLPILQHALMRTWEEWRTHCEDGTPIDLKDYDAVGGMEGALSKHADDAYEKLPDDRHRAAARVLFQCLTGKDRDGREARHPMALETIKEVAGANAHLVGDVVDHFRKPDRAFLMPPARVPIRDGSIIDISHESLIRCWPRLTRWADEEAEAASTYRRLAEDAALHDENRKGLWGDPELQLALNWREKWKPNVEWAKRYNAGFELAMAFLGESRRVRDKQRRRKLRLRGVVAAAVIGAILVFAVAQWMYAEATQRYAEKTRKYAEETLRESQRTQSVFLASLADERLGARDMGTALQFALARPEAVLPHIARPELQIESALRGLRESLVLPVDGGAVRCAAFSPNGKLIATASADGVVRLWNAENGQRLGELSDASGEAQANSGSMPEVYRAAFSPDGKLIAAASADNMVRVWDVETHKLVRALAGHDGEVYGAAFSADGKSIVTASADGRALVWDLEKGATIGTKLTHTDAVTSAHFSPDGRRIVTSSADGYVWLWDAATGENIAKLAHGGRATQAIFSSDGRRIASTSWNGTAVVWDADTQQKVRTFEVKQEIDDAEFSPDGQRIVTASADGVARLWDIETATLVGAPFVGHANSAGRTTRLLSAAFSRDGLWLVTASEDETARVWSIEPEKGLPLGPQSGIVSSAIFDPTGARVVTTSDDGIAIIWDANTGAMLQPLEARHGPAISAAYSFDGRLLAVAYADGQAQIWDVKTWKSTGKSLVGHFKNKKIYSVAFSHDNKRLVTASDDGDVRVWDAETSGQVGLLPGNGEPVRSAVFSPDDKQILTAGRDRRLRIWDSGTYKLVRRFPDGGFALRGAAYRADGKLIVATSVGGTAQIWDATSETPRNIGANNGALTSAVFSPNGERILAASEDLAARVWDANSGELLAPPFAGEGGQMSNAAYSPDGRRLVIASSRGVRIWAIATDAASLREIAKNRVPRCLTSDQLDAAFLRANPDWCRKEKKWPEVSNHDRP